MFLVIEKSDIQAIYRGLLANVMHWPSAFLSRINCHLCLGIALSLTRNMCDQTLPCLSTSNSSRDPLNITGLSLAPGHPVQEFRLELRVAVFAGASGEGESHDHVATLTRRSPICLRDNVLQNSRMVSSAVTFPVLPFQIDDRTPSKGAILV